MEVWREGLQTKSIVYFHCATTTHDIYYIQCSTNKHFLGNTEKVYYTFEITSKKTSRNKQKPKMTRFLYLMLLILVGVAVGYKFINERNI